MLEKGQESRRELAKKTPLLSSALGSMWAEHKTSWSDVRALAAWTRVAMSELGGTRLLTFAARTQDLRAFSGFADKLEVSAKAALLTFEELQKSVRADTQLVFGIENYNSVPIARLSARLSIWCDNIDAINDWVSVRDALLHLRSEGLSIIADRLINGSI